MRGLEQPFRIRRLGVVMEPLRDDPAEAWGVLNPACARSRGGELFLFPRVVAENNYSRIAIARVLFDRSGDPRGVERLGYALEPAPSYEQNRRTAGCEDARIVYVAALGAYLMTYTAFGPMGPRIAVAASKDLFIWRRLGLVKFASSHGVEFGFYDNKDGVILPEVVLDPRGRPALALIHRPTYDVSLDGGPAQLICPEGIFDPRPSMWISYCPIEHIDSPLETLPPFAHHRVLAVPEQPWEALKVGGGTPPIRTRHGWLMLFHGVSVSDPLRGTGVRYSAGALVLDGDDPSRVIYRSATPILEPATQDELRGVVDNVVFPTSVDMRGNERVDVYYGMADSRIGVGTFRIPETLPMPAMPKVAA